jgi:hypothetical protein
VVEINHVLLEGLVDIRVSMSIMAASVVKEFGIMHLVLRHETYKIASGMITQALGRIIDIPVIIGKVAYQMVFLIINTNIYDLFLKLDFHMKIRAMVDVERGLYRLGMVQEWQLKFSPLNVVNML